MRCKLACFLCDFQQGSGMKRKLWIGMGCNLGDRQAQMRRAADLLESRFAPCRFSLIYETPPLLPENPKPGWENLPYLNRAMQGETAMQPLEVMEFLQATERELGRMPRERWAPREMDLDLLMMEGVTMQTERLTLPHPRMQERDFVLKPLAELGVRILVL
jgi:2-amino-4-hydroxy-6-hydroxymethyldihydropteridine diphosphokinase